MKRCAQLILLLGAIFLTGCWGDITKNRFTTGTVHIDKFPPFKNYVETPLELKRTAYLKVDKGLFADDYFLESEEFKNSFPNDHRETIALSPGTTILLHSISRDFDFEGGSYSFEARGEVKLPQKGKVQFEYIWGYGDIERAPWESEDVPPKRYWDDKTKKLGPLN
jgi:hypothetical protein